jgi:hypothetical protein
MSIRINPNHKGALHRATHTPIGQKITQAKIMAAEHSRSAKVRKEADFAAAAEHWDHHRSKA